MAKTKTTLERVHYDEKADSHVPGEGTRQNPPEQLSEVEISHLPEKELRIAVAKDLGKTMEKM